mgnify:CR=1 FL=1
MVLKYIRTPACSHVKPRGGFRSPAGQRIHRPRRWGGGRGSWGRGEACPGRGHTLCALSRARQPQAPPRVTPPDAASRVTSLQAGMCHGCRAQGLYPLPSRSDPLTGRPVGGPLPSASAAPTVFRGAAHRLQAGCRTARCLLLPGARWASCQLLAAALPRDESPGPRGGTVADWPCGGPPVPSIDKT